MTSAAMLFGVMMIWMTADTSATPWSFQDGNHCLFSNATGPCEYCEPGWYGDHCQHRCIGHCEMDLCNQTTGSCLQCKPGFYSNNCNMTCPVTCGRDADGNTYCSRESGECVEGCKQSWWGEKCEKRCSDNCLDEQCLSYNGHCSFGCVLGLTGIRCDKKCPDGCVEQCYQWNEKCNLGCITGYYGDKCNRKCNTGCKRSVCDQANGRCSEGCQNGLYGDYCTKVMPFTWTMRTSPATSKTDVKPVTSGKQGRELPESVVSEVLTPIALGIAGAIVLVVVTAVGIFIVFKIRGGYRIFLWEGCTSYQHCDFFKPYPRICAIADLHRL